MKLKDSRRTKKNRRNISKNNKRMLENADILSNGKVTVAREELVKLAEWRKTIRKSIEQWRENHEKFK